MKKKSIDSVIESNELIENIKSAILGNTIITIRDSNNHELLWSCNSDKFYGKFKKYEGKLEIDQDIDLFNILNELKGIIK